MTYSTEQQTQIIKMKGEGKSSRKIANELGLSKSGVNDFLARVTKETEYLMQGENGKRLLDSLSQIKFAKATGIELEGGSPLVRYVNTLGMFGNADPESIIPFTRNEEGELGIKVHPSSVGYEPSNSNLGHLGEAYSGQESPLAYTLSKLDDKGFTDALEHLGENGLGKTSINIVNHVDDCRKVKVEKREKPLMKIVTSPLRVGGKTHMYIGDSQVKPDVSFEYLRCKGEYIVEKKPDVIIFGGDFADMPSLSSYDKGKGKAEGKRVKKDIEAAIKGMQTLLKPLYDFQQKQLQDFGFIGYKPRMLITLGNHEDRITRYTNDNPELIDFISIDSLKYEEQGLEVYPFLEPVLVDGITYIHYLPNEFTGKPQGGNALKILADFGGSITQGHKQTLVVATRFAPATSQQTWFIQAGACYDHNEAYKGLYNNNHFRGLIMKYNLDGKGNYDLHTVSLKYIMDKYSWL